MRRFAVVALLVLSVLVASCASGPSIRNDRQCSDTPRSALGKFFQGIAEVNFGLIGEAILDGISVWRVFGDSDGRRGKEVVRQIAANPEIASEDGSCDCSLLSMTDTSDPDVKLVVVKRTVMVQDDARDYKRAFHVRFEPRGNCILTVDSIDTKWERM